LFLLLVGVFAWPQRCPAPLIYRPGEGWTYESVGGAKWERPNAPQQYEVAKAAFDKKDYSLARKASRRILRRWPNSDFAPQALYLLGRCYEARRTDDKAFDEYQRLAEKYPKFENYQEVLRRQFEIADRLLAHRWFRRWGFLPWCHTIEKTADMFAKLIRNGPYSDVAPQAQLKIGQAREKQKDYMSAVKAYEKAADLYHDQPVIAAEGTFKAAQAYLKQAQKAEYDQSAATQAIETFKGFVVLYPNDPRVKEAQRVASELRTEQARGSFLIARFYEQKRQWSGASIYYSDVVEKDPDSKYAAVAKQRIEELNKLAAEQKP